MRPRRVMASIRRMSPLARTLPLARLDGMVIAATDDQVPDRGLGALGEAAVDQAEVDEVAADMALTCGAKGTRTPGLLDANHIFCISTSPSVA